MNASAHPTSSRSAILAAALVLMGAAPRVSGQEVELLAVGDIEWSRIVQTPTVFTYRAEGESAWTQVPYTNRPDSRTHLESLGRQLETPRSHHVRAIQYGLEFATEEDMARYPFRRTADVLRSADITFANLETPLSDRADRIGAFRTPTAVADGLAWAGIDVVSTANNHAYDAGESGVLDTREALFRAGVGAAGTGRSLADARRPFVVEREGITVGFLAYTWSVNMGTWAFATDERAGAAPLDPYLIEDDIRALRERADVVVLSFHWGIENSQDTHADARAFAHRMIDAGADVILGHHPHVPRGVEMYRDGAIVYSMGNFVFGHSHDYWGNNIMVRLRLTRSGASSMEIVPIAGADTNLAQPYILEGSEAITVLEDIRDRSALLDTEMSIEGGRGWVRW